MSDPVTRLNAALEGRYTIERELGEGGMATVYLAEDIKHNRKVALKVLKPELAAVVGAERFLTEIQVTANLQHPHILPLFDSGEADSFLFYVMPYVVGETLKERIKREKQLPVDNAVGIATAVASALDYAHRHKVIHRDIKPANILIQDGEPVVSDFGIALAVGAGGGDRLTETGLSLGTPYYMSPEQATGDQPVGSSTDTYALGSVLYEMLVGEPPYPGTTTQAVLGKIIAGKPVSAAEHRSSVPRNVDAAIRCAIEKLPADRFTSVQEFVRALEDPGFRYGELAGAAASEAAGRWSGLTIGFAATAVALGAAVGWSLLRPDSPQPVTRIALTAPSEVTIGAWRGLAVSPGGRTVVFADDVTGQLYHRDLRGLDAVPIPGTENAWYPFFSPDGEWVGYFDQGEATLNKTRLDGSAAQTLAPAPGTNRSAGWGSDGTIVLHSNALDGLWRLRDTGGEIEQVANTEGPQLRWLDLLPDGRAVLGQTVGGEPQVVAVSLETGERTVLFAGTTPRYVGTGHVVFWRDNALWAVPFDPEQLLAIGQPTPVVEDVRLMANSFANFAVGGDLLFYLEGEGLEGLVPLWLGRDGSEQSLDPALTGLFEDPAFSPDDRRVALQRQIEGEPEDIWIYDLEQRTLSRLTFGDGRNLQPFWSPDGTEVGFSSNRDGLFALYSRPADLSGDARLLVSDPDDSLYEGTWTPDGQSLVYRWGSGTTNNIRDLWYSGPDLDGTPVVILGTPAAEHTPSLSPDGRWLAYASDESGQYEVYVRPFPGPGGQSLVSVNGGFNPKWAHSGREIFYLGPDAVFNVAAVRTDPDFAVDSREQLDSRAYFWQRTHRHWDLTPDDQRLLAIGVPPEAGGVGRYIIVQNWFEELRALAGN